MAVPLNWPWSKLRSLESSFGWLPWGICILLVYTTLCITVRRRQMQKASRREEEALESRGDDITMTLEEAYLIKTRLAEQEFPLVFSAAMASVFFKAEAIPSIASLVARAARRSIPPPSPSASTSTSSHSHNRNPPESRKNHSQKPSSIPPSALLSHPSSPERKAAIDHVNRIHERYRPSASDLMYYRPPSKTERAALALLWMDIGQKLRIPSLLTSHKEERERRSVKEALAWLKEIETRCLVYERRFRRKSTDGVFLARLNLDKWASNLLLSLFPLPLLSPLREQLLRPAARHAVAVLIEPDLRAVMGIDDPPIVIVGIVRAVIAVRRYVRGYLCSPLVLLAEVYSPYSKDEGKW
ncbi:hypothetical protein F5Y17DRAFT_477762 [Xylariaceae sp. FL0594]|nr:hypothetical protein F5Y17DRAFT_477762 [Xylariaceae sp. FL0594]